MTANTQTIVIKYGGNAMKDEAIKNDILDDIAELHNAGHSVILAHGGGPFINRLLSEANVTSTFIEGQRQTTDEAIRYIEMALTGEVNPDLVRQLKKRGINAVGISGKDGGLMEVEKWIPVINGKQIDLGWVGHIVKTNPQILQILIDQHFFPVIACLGADLQGKAYNINGDIFASNVAGALKADRFVVMTDVDGLCEDKDKPETLISALTIADMEKLKGTVIQGGMIPKMDACKLALEQGAQKVNIINGTKKGTLTDLVLNNAKLGTTMTNL